jgi:Fic family protein
MIIPDKCLKCKDFNKFQKGNLCFNKMREICEKCSKAPKDKEIKEFLKESNAIEGEYSDNALRDAMNSWILAVVMRREFSVGYICAIHRRLMRRLNPRIAGTIRNCPVRIGGEIRNQDMQQIKVELEAWLEHQFTRKDERGIIQSHIVFEKIHPFEDGNGRVGRILMNIQRLNAGLPLLIIHTGKEQQEYYRWFKGKK